MSPSGAVISFLTDTLERQGGKKGSTQEILDSSESITQDQGNKTYTFPMTIYFPGEDYDLAADPLIKAFEEKYTQDFPGILQHPRWGDINVFPLTWSQKEELVKGSQISYIEVTFVQSFPKKYPATDQASIDSALSNIDNMSSSAQLIADASAAAANIAGKIESAVGIISGALEAVTAGIEAIEDTMNAIQSGIDGMIDDIAGNAFLLVSAAQRLMRAPARIKDSTLDKIDVYTQMTKDLCDTFFDPNETSPVNKRNNAIMLESIGGYAAAVTAEAAVFTDYSIRTQSISAIESINDSLDYYNSKIALARTDGNVSDEFSGDHNFYSLLMDTIARINESLLNKTFSLKAEKKFILKQNSDSITLCYENYGKVDNDTIIFFQNTNKLIENEFIEIPAGREIVVYI